MTDKTEILFELNCEHKYFESKRVKNVQFCSKCGIMKYANIQTCRPQILNHQCDYDPLEVFNDRVMEEMKIVIDYNNDSHLEYCNKRHYILQFLKSLVERHHFRTSIYYLAVLYLDVLLLSNPNFNEEMAAYSCFLLASKFYEYDPKLPSVKQIGQSLVGKSAEKDVKKSEIICLKLLSYKLDRMTAYDYMEFFLKNGVIFDHEYNLEFNLKEFNEFAFDILDSFFSDNRFLDFTPLQVTCAILTFTRETFNLRKGWNRKLTEIYNIKLEDFMNCYFVVKTIYSQETSQKIDCYSDSYNEDCTVSTTTTNYYYPVQSETAWISEEARTPSNMYNYFYHLNENELNSTFDESFYSCAKSNSNSTNHQAKYYNNTSSYLNVINSNLTSNANSNYNSNGNVPSPLYSWYSLNCHCLANCQLNCNNYNNNNKSYNNNFPLIYVNNIFQ